jgi:hypothetical protein
MLDSHFYNNAYLSVCGKVTQSMSTVFLLE